MGVNELVLVCLYRPWKQLECLPRLKPIVSIKNIDSGRKLYPDTRKHPFAGALMMLCRCLAITYICPQLQVLRVMANHRSVSILRMTRATERPHSCDPGVPTKSPTRT